MAFLANLLVRIGVDTSELGRGLSRADRSVKTFGNDLQNMGSTLGVAVSAPLIGLGAAALQMSGKMEQASIGFTTLLKSADAAQAHLEQLKQFALKTPFQFTELVDASRLMQAYGFAAEDVIPKLRLLGDAVSALGGGRELLERVVRSMGEIGTRGKVTGEQLRELSRAGIPALEAIAKKLGVSMAEAQKKITDGAVDAQTASEALFDYMSRRFGGGMEAQAKSLLGMWSNVRDAITFTLADVGSSIAPIAKRIISEHIQPMLQKVRELAGAFNTLPSAIQTSILALGGVAAIGPLATIGLGMFISNAVVLIGVFSKLSAAAVAVGAGIRTGLITQLVALGGTATSITPALAALAGALAAVTLAIDIKLIWDAVRAYAALRAATANLEQAQQSQADTAAIMAARLKAHGVDIRAIEELYRSGEMPLDQYLAALRRLVQQHEANAVAAGQHRAAIKALSAEEITKAFSAVGIKDLTAEAKAAQAGFDQLRAAGLLTGGLLQNAAIAVAEAWKKAKEQAAGFTGLFKNQPKLETESFLPASVPSGRGGNLMGSGELQARELFDLAAGADRATRAINALSEEMSTGMREAGINTYQAAQALKQLGPIGEQVRMQLNAESISDAFKELNVTSTGQLSELASAAKMRFEEINAAVGLSYTDRLRAQTAWIDAELAALRDLAENQKGLDRKQTLEKIHNLEDLERKNREVLNRVTGDTERKTRDISGFWRKMGAQVSTIMTDLSRRILDVIWPKSTGGATNAQAITALGIAAGVTGSQLAALATAVENLALATGENFATIAEGVGELFGNWNVAVADQIPLLNALYNVCLKTGIGLDDLLDSLNEGAPAFIALGWSATEAAAFLGNLKRQGVDTKTVVGALNTALKNLKDQGFVDPQKALQDLILKIKNAATESEATETAIKYFGTAGQEMARIIRAGNFDLASFNSLIDTSSSAMTTAASEARKLTEEQGKLKAILDEVGRAILRAFTEAGMTALTDWIRESGVLKTAWEGIKSVFSSVADWLGVIKDKAPVAIDALSQLPDWATQQPTLPGPPTGGTAPTGGTGGGAGGAAGGAASGVMGIINVVTGAITAISSVIGNFQMAGMNATLGLIEESTRYTKIWTGEGSDSILGHLQSLDDHIKYLWAGMQTVCLDLGDMMAKGDTIIGHLSSIASSVMGTSYPSGEGMRFAYAGGAAGGGDTFNIYINGTSEPGSAEAMSYFREGARILRSRGVRHTTGIR